MPNAMLHRVVDYGTLLQSLHEKIGVERLWRLTRLPGMRTLLLTLPTRLLAAAVAAVSHLAPHSRAYRSLVAAIPEMRVAQVGGITRTAFDTATHIARFNTHDWHAGPDSSHGGSYIKISGLALPSDDESFDVLASRHVLEHISNPISALLEWKRVLRKGAYLYVSVPDRRKTAERRRALTPLAHFIADYESAVPELDPTHETEIQRAGVGLIEHNRYENPHIHYHTFEASNLGELLTYCGYQIIALTPRDLQEFRHRPWDLIALARKPAS